MRFAFLLVALGAAAALAADPEGTIAFDLAVGESKAISATPSAAVICDDASIVTPEYTPDGNNLALRGLKAGSTLCGVWYPDQVPGGLYRVNVTVSEPPDAGVADAGAASDGGVAPDAGAASDGGVASRDR